MNEDQNSGSSDGHVVAIKSTSVRPSSNSASNMHRTVDGMVARRPGKPNVTPMQEPQIAVVPTQPVEIAQPVVAAAVAVAPVAEPVAVSNPVQTLPVAATTPPVQPVASPVVTPSVTSIQGAQPVNNAVEQVAIKSKKRGFAKMAIVVVFVFVLLTGLIGAVFAGFAYYQLNKPENILLQAVANSFEPTIDYPGAKITSMTIDGTISYTDGDSSQKQTVEVEGEFDYSEDSFEIGAKLDYGIAKPGLKLGVYNQDSYLNVSGISLLAQLVSIGDSEAASSLSKIDGSWIGIDNGLLTGRGLVEKRSGEISDEEKSAIKIAFLSNRVITIKENIGQVELDGQSVEHYKVRINTSAAISLAEEMNRIDGDATGVTDKSVTSIKKFAAELDKTVYDLDIWVSPNDRLIRRIEARLDRAEGVIEATINFGGYNEPVNLARPVNALNLSDILRSLAPILGEEGPVKILQGGLQSLLPSTDTALEGATSLLQNVSAGDFPTFTLGDTDENR